MSDVSITMSIDTSGKWWVGSALTDLHEYLKALADDSYPVHEFRLARCPCGGERFELHVEQAEGVARRTCIQCKARHWIADSAEHLESRTRLKRYKCITCKSTHANVGVGYSLYEDATAIRWLYVGNRCAECGVLGSMVNWKVGYEPSLQLLGDALTTCNSGR